DAQSVVIHLNSFSKVLAPGLRLGWLSAAEAIVEQLTLIKQRADPHTHNLVQHVVTDLLDDGTFDTHVADLRAEHRRRRDAVDGAVRKHAADLLHWRSAEGGLYLWCHLLGRASAARVAARALDASVAVASGQLFYADRAGDRELRVCFSSVPVARAADMAERLAKEVIARQPRHTAPPPPTP